MIEIRGATLADLDRIVEFQLKMARETEGLRLDRDVVRQGVHGVFEEPGRGTYWVAAEADDIVAVLLAVPEWSDWRNGIALWIHSLYVVPEARQRGVYKRLYLHLKRLVEDSQNLVGLRLYVDKRNKSAQQIYEKLGMNKDHYELYEWLK